jgi:hypothetical protein
VIRSKSAPVKPGEDKRLLSASFLERRRKKGRKGEEEWGRSEKNGGRSPTIREGANGAEIKG